jgi:alpha-beta hydrolase superfamily lysophospholipase
MHHHEDFFETTSNLRLYEQSWRLENPAAIIVIVHGYGEHSGRYCWVASQLVCQGLAVYTFDLRGHGKSEGERGFVESFDDYLRDLEFFLHRVKAREPGKPLFLLGHSMGGTISTLFVIRQQPALSGLVVSSAVLGISSHIPLMLVRAMIGVGQLVPKLPTIRIDTCKISRAQEIVRAYETDPLVYHRRIPARTLVEILKAIFEIQSHAFEIGLPLLIQHGTDDQIVTVEGSQQLYASVQSDNKYLKLYNHCYHELLNEPEKVLVLSNIATWIQKLFSVS